MRILRFVALFVSMLTCIVSQALTEDTFSSDGWVFKVFPEDSSTVKLTGYERCNNLKTIKIGSENKHLDSRCNSNAIIDTEEDEILAACSASNIPSSVRKIGEKAFYHCYNLKSLVILINPGYESLNHSHPHGNGPSPDDEEYYATLRNRKNQELYDYEYMFVYNPLNGSYTPVDPR